jgi:pantetheine-phosphate adenylyltransferase
MPKDPAQRVKAVYPGSFDPPTLGHLDIIERAVKIFGSLTILIAKSSRKESMFSNAERKALMEASLKSVGSEKIDLSKRVIVEMHDGLTVDYMRKHNANVIIRGLRAVSDFEYEFQMATMNRKLHPEIETLTIMTGETFYYIASSTIKEVAVHGGDISQLVPKPVLEAVKKKFKL